MSKEDNMQNPISFEGLDIKHLYFYEKKEFRNPRKGEWFLSGAIVSAYMAPNDLDTKYWIVKPTFQAIRTTTYIPGREVKYV